MLPLALQCSLHCGNADDNVNEEDNKGRTRFMLAASDGHVECLKGWLSTGMVDVTKRDKEGSTAFMLAAGNGHLEIVRFLLESGMAADDINMEDSRGQTAFFFAANKGHVECLKLLLSTGMVDVKKIDKEGLTALMSAASNGHVDCVEFLLGTELIDVIDMKNKRGLTAFMEAAMNGHVGCVTVLLDTGMVDLNREDKNGFNAVMLGSQNGHVECIKFLIGTGSVNDINKEGYKGFTAFMLAAKNGHTECVKFLEGTGMMTRDDINKANDDGMTAFMLAAKNGHEGCVQFLLGTRKVDNLNKKDLFERTAFALAANRGHTQILRCILNISVTSHHPSNDEHSEDIIGSWSVFTPNDSTTTWFVCESGISWKSPYVFDRGQQERQSSVAARGRPESWHWPEQSASRRQEGVLFTSSLGQLPPTGKAGSRFGDVLKVVVGRGLSLCIVCQLVGGLDAPLTRHSDCRHEGLERSALDITDYTNMTALMLAAKGEYEQCVDYVLQYERVRFHTLAVLLNDNFTRTNQISLTLYRKLCSLIWDSSQLNRFLSMLCDGSHLGRCVDFLLSTFIQQANPEGRSAYRCACHSKKLEICEVLLQHMITPSYIERLQDDASSIFFGTLPGALRQINEQSHTWKSLNLHLNAFLRNGIFQWSWYPIFPHSRLLARALIIEGYSPGEFVEWTGTTSSPLNEAFLRQDEGLVRYLVANLYLTPGDLVPSEKRRMRTRNFVQRNGSKSLQSLHHLVFCTPWKLRVLSLVKVSTFLMVKRRKEDMAPVDSLPLPRAIKKHMSFVDPIRMVDEREWNSIDIETWLC